MRQLTTRQKSDLHRAIMEKVSDNLEIALNEALTKKPLNMIERENNVKRWKDNGYYQTKHSVTWHRLNEILTRIDFSKSFPTSIPASDLNFLKMILQISNEGENVYNNRSLAIRFNEILNDNARIVLCQYFGIDDPLDYEDKNIYPDRFYV